MARVGDLIRKMNLVSTQFSFVPIFIRNKFSRKNSMQKSGMKMIVVLYMHLDAKGSAAFQSAV